MDVSKSAALLKIDRFRPPKDIRTSILASSFMERDSRVIDGLEMHDRFEQVFLESPRAQELYSSLEKAKKWKVTPQKPVFSGVPGFNEVFNLAESFHSNTSRTMNSSATSLIAHHSSAAEKRGPFFSSTRIGDFEVSPYKPSEIDSAIKRKVGMAINKLERDNASICDKAKNKGLCHVSGFTDPQSDSGVSMEGSLTNVTPGWKSQQQRSVIYEKRRVGGKFPGLYSTNTEAVITVPQPVLENQEVSLHNYSDEEVDVVTEDVEDEKEDPVVGDGTYNFTVQGGTKSLPQFSMVNKDHYPRIVNEEQRQEETRNTAENSEASCSVIDDVVPETPQVIGDKNSLLINGSEVKAKINNKKQEEESTVNRPHGKTGVDVNTVSQWSIKALKTRTHMGIIVEGQRRKDPDGDLWHSTAIVLRVNSRCVQTKSGSRYLLEGPIDEKVTLEQGFSKDFVKAFRNGFPTNWLSHVAKHFEPESGAEESEIEKKLEQHRRVRNKKPSKASSHSMKSTPDNLKKQDKAKKDLKTPDNTLLPKEVELQKTRSGRMVKPPLAWWRGQRIVTDRDHNMEGIAPGGQEHTPLSALYNIEIKIPLVDGVGSADKTSRSLQLRVSKSDVESNEDVPRKIQSNKTRLNIRKLKSNESQVLAEKEEKENTAKAGPLKSEQSCYSSGNLQIPEPQEKDPIEQDKRESKGRKSKPLKIGAEEKFSDKNKEFASKRYQLRDVIAYKSRPRRTSDASELDGSSSSSSNSREDILKKQLFSSPRGTSEKQTHDHKVTRRGLEIEVGSTEEGARKSDDKEKSFNKSHKDQRYNTKKVAADRLPKSSRLTAQESCHSEPSGSEGEIPRNHKIRTIISKKPTTKKVAQQNKKIERHRISNNLITESESESTEQVEVKIPTPPKRVLRSHMSRVGSTANSNTGVSSEVDSEDLQDQTHKKNSLRQRKSRDQKKQYSDSGSRFSSGDETGSTCSTGHSENISKTRRKTKIIDKIPVYKRISEIARETLSSDSQTSEEEYGKTSNKRSKKEQINKSRAKGVKQLEELRREMMDGNKRTQSATRKGNGRNESDSDVVVGNKKVSKVTPRTATNNGNPAEELYEHSWKDDEIQRLNEALCVIPASIPMFWQKIASRVKSRTAQECQFQHQGQALVSNKKEAPGKKGTAVDKKKLGQKVNSKPGVKTVTGGVGTIKRKRELRELLEQQDVNYEDDIFDATPFKRKKNLKLPFNLNCNDSDEGQDDDEDGDESEREQSTSYKTPSSRFRPLGPLSTSTTPGSDFISPSLLQQVNRKDMDHYIYRMQQGKRGVQTQVAKQKAKMKTSTPKKTGGQWPTLDVELFEAQPHSSEEDEEQDYYFSDE